MKMNEENAVVVRSAYKRYTPKAVILNGLNMTVPEGTIYGLLGPSGCGKTTLLSSMVGMQRLDSGTIELSANRRAEIGYMPQEISLNLEFTIREILHFYGRLYQLPFERIDRAGGELLKMLELPPMDRTVGNCSGGQQRRISMAVTLLHDPNLLILDEPTVGVDPLLSHSIWEYFKELVRTRHKTIIITTHYIEEARNANLIGLMRGGVLLAEEPPGYLMEQYQSDTLEDVFLKLSAKQEEESAALLAPYPRKQPNEHPLQPEGAFNVERFKAQLIKNFHWTRKNLTVTLFVVCLPAILFTITGQISSHGADYPVSPKPLAVFNDETDCYNKTQMLQLANKCAVTRPFSCRYLDYLDRVFSMVEVSSVEEGIDYVHHGRAVGVLFFGRNFSIDLMARLKDASSLTNKRLRSSSVRSWMDMSDFGATVRTLRELRQSIISVLKDVSEECGYERKYAGVPIEFQTPVFNSLSILEAILPPYFCSVAFYTTSMFTSSAIVMERASGLLERSQAAGLTIAEILVAQMVIQLFVMTLQNILSFWVLYGVFSYQMHGSYGLAYSIISINELAGMTYGFLLSMLIKEEKNVAYAGIGTVLSLFMLTGSVWPVEGMHWLLVPLSRMMPVLYSAEAYFNVTMRGWTIAYPTVYMSFITSTVAIAALSSLSYLAFKFKVGTI